MLRCFWKRTYRTSSFDESSCHPPRLGRYFSTRTHNDCGFRSILDRREDSFGDLRITARLPGAVDDR